MATRKSGSGAKANKTTATKVTTVKAGTSTKNTQDKKQKAPNYAAIVLAEIIGTFILTLVVLSSVQLVTPLFIGLTVTVLVLAIGAISGAHLNPAVTFGLWSARKLKTILLPVYWVAQFVGAILAVLLLGAYSGGYPLSFDHFATFDWSIVGIEIVATAIFLFGLVAVVSNDSAKKLAKALGIGLSLTVAIVVSVALFNTFKNNADTSNADVSSLETVPRAYLVDGATLNPAVALAVTEKTSTDLGGYTTEDQTRFSRLGLEVIVGTLIGAALGANAYLLLAYVSRQEN